jgi:hypothetical protein
MTAKAANPIVDDVDGFLDQSRSRHPHGHLQGHTCGFSHETTISDAEKGNQSR